MEEIKLDVQIRNESRTRKLKEIRRQDFIPAVVYGGGKSTTSVKVDRRTFERLMRLHQNESIIFHLNVMEEDKKRVDYSVITKEIQYNPVSSRVLHIDFKRISLKEKIEVEISVVTKGEPIGIKQEGGSLDHILRKLNIVCLPTNIPQHIEVDVSSLKIHDMIHVKDLDLPKEITVRNDPEAIVVSVSPPMKEEVETPQEMPVEPEVIKEKKEPKKEDKAGGEQK